MTGAAKGGGYREEGGININASSVGDVVLDIDRE
jgi:hypothetical protein